jgi:hypothetical protein
VDWLPNDPNVLIGECEWCHSTPRLVKTCTQMVREPQAEDDYGEFRDVNLCGNCYEQEKSREPDPPAVR